MRIPVLFLLVLLLFINFFGFYVAFVVKQVDIRKEMADLIKNKPLNDYQAMSLSKSDFEQIVWKRAGKEFLLNGRIYDVAHIETSGDKVDLYVECDEGETNLVSNFAAVIGKRCENDGANSPVKNLLLHFLQEFTSPFNNFNLFSQPLRLVSFTQDDFGLRTFITELHSPPPQAKHRT